MYDFDRSTGFRRYRPTSSRATADRVIAYLRTRSVETWAFFAAGLALGAWFG